MELKLNSQRIFEIGQNISNQLHDAGIEQETQLIINVSKRELQKIDEDLFYRREHDKDEKFIPSDNEINVNFQNLKIIICGH